MLGSSMAKAMTKYFPRNSRDEIHPEEFQFLTEAVPVRTELCRKNGVLSSQNFMDAVKKHIIAPAEGGSAFVAYPCMIAEDNLTALASWKDWVTFLHYINRRGLAGYIAFENTRYRHQNAVFYASELRVYPALKIRL